jgi:hypothetical protein
VELSPTDRALLMKVAQVANRPIVVEAAGQRIATASAAGSGSIARRGGA